MRGRISVGASLDPDGVQAEPADGGDEARAGQGDQPGEQDAPSDAPADALVFQEFLEEFGVAPWLRVRLQELCEQAAGYVPAATQNKEM